MIIFLAILLAISLFSSIYLLQQRSDLGDKVDDLRESLKKESEISSAWEQKAREAFTRHDKLSDDINKIREERQQFIIQIQDNAEKQYQKYKEEELFALREIEKKNAIDSANIKLEEHIRDFEKETRADAISKSQAVNLGKITEHLIPFFPNFPFDSTECRFLGSPIDLICFQGLSQDKVEKVIFCEIKTGKSALSKREKSLRDAIIRKEVEWIELRNTYEAKE